MYIYKEIKSGYSRHDSIIMWVAALFTTILVLGMHTWMQSKCWVCMQWNVYWFSVQHTMMYGLKATGKLQATLFIYFEINS